MSLDQPQTSAPLSQSVNKSRKSNTEGFDPDKNKSEQ